MNYAELLLAFGILPIIILWVWRWGTVRKYAGSLLTIVALILMVSVPWELMSVGRLWYYSPRIVWGPNLFHIPLEELAFYVIDALLVGTLAVLLYEKKPHKA